MNAIPRWTAAALAICLAGCGNLQPFVADTARLPRGWPVGINQDTSAVYQAQYLFAMPSRTQNNPIAGARAAADMDYIAGQFNTSPRWTNISATTQMQLLQGRDEVRQTLGVAPNATSQQVVDHLTWAANALETGDRAAAVRLLGPPVFLPGGEAVLATLANLPYLQMANVSTSRVSGELFQSDGPLLNP